MVCKDHGSYCLNTACEIFFTDCTAIASGICNDRCHCVYYHSSENEVKPSSLITSLMMSKHLLLHSDIWGVSNLYHNLGVMFPLEMMMFMKSRLQHCKMKHSTKSK
jgi:hypothetical protein